MVAPMSDGQFTPHAAVLWGTITKKARAESGEGVVRKVPDLGADRGFHRRRKKGRFNSERAM